MLTDQDKELYEKVQKTFFFAADLCSAEPGKDYTASELEQTLEVLALAAMFVEKFLEDREDPLAMAPAASGLVQ